MKTRLLLAFCTLLFSAYAEEPKSILFIAGTPSHGAGEHEHHDGCKVLAKALDDSGLNLKTAIHYDTWPDSTACEGVDAVAIYSDGDQKHIALGHEAELQALSDRGVGIVCLHYCVDGEPGLLNETLLNVIGGYYDETQSINPE